MAATTVPSRAIASHRRHSPPRLSRRHQSALLAVIATVPFTYGVFELGLWLLRTH
jgi:hypothetical protein